MKRIPDIVFYHADCYDGFGAAWAIDFAQRKFGDPGHQVRYIPVQYNKPLPPEDYRCDLLYIVDFSLPPEQLDQLSALAGKIVIIDHHKSAEAMLADVPKIYLGQDPDEFPYDVLAYFDMMKSGAVLTWEHFHMTNAPPLLRYIQDRDLWRWELDETRPINSYLSTVPFTFPAFSLAHTMFFNEGLDQMISSGRTVELYRDKLVQEICKSARVTWYTTKDGVRHSCVAVRSSILQSEVGHHLCQLFPAQSFAIIYSDIPGDPDNIKWSLRSEGDFDITTIAKEHGGGGHRNAGGMTTPTWRMV